MPPTKERYCSIVSFGGVDTGKSKFKERERREEKRRKSQYLPQLKTENEKDENRNKMGNSGSGTDR